MFAYSNGKVTVRFGPMAKRGMYAALLLLLTVILIFCTGYIASGYERLRQWYVSLNDCFYAMDKWESSFFTSATKKRGNVFASLGMGTSLYGMYLVMRQWRGAAKNEHTISYSIIELGWYILVALVGIAAAMREWQMMPPAYDEIFSAVNCAEMHPLQTWSYYMLPNNHLLFNVVNGLLFGWHGHLVGTGRLISVVAYVCTLLVAFRWLTRNMGSHLLAFIAVLPVAFQFVVWGMSAQARGYECQLLCGWVAFVSLLRIVNYKEGFLKVNAIANIAGFALIPSWFYFFGAQLLFVAGMGLINSRTSWRYWKYQAAIVAGVFLFYLPAVCFSGMDALSGNKYVRAAPEGLSVFIPNLISLGKNFVSYCFSYLATEGSVLSYLLFALPLLLLLTKQHRRLAGFYAAIWAAYLLCSLYIKHTPFHRTLIVHFSITMALVVYTLWVFASYMANMLRQRFVAAVNVAVFVIPVMALSVWLARFDKDNINFGLYSNDVNGLYNMHLSTIGNIPNGSSVAFSDESFYFYYHCRRLGYKVNRCAMGQEQYYVKRSDEQMPAAYKAWYILLLQGGEDYEIYRKK